MTTEYFLIGRQAPVRLLGEQTVGRSSTVELRIDDVSVSRRHARVILQANRVIVEDLKSRNGTFINESAITTAELPLRGTVRFGLVSFCLSDRWESLHEVASSWESTPPVGSYAKLAEVDLSPAQQRVFRELLLGFTEKEVANRLHVAPSTVHNHIRKIYERLGVNSRAELLSRFVAGPGRILPPLGGGRSEST